jgi:phospholipase C
VDRRRITRRSFLRSTAVLGGATAAGAALRPGHARLLDAALAADVSSTASLSDVEHIVVLMQENRSFDHYFGTLSDVRGFSDPQVPTQVVGGQRLSVFDQFGPSGYEVGSDRFLQPFELVSNFPNEDGQTTNDITHDWGPQHFSWNSGAMDNFLAAHLASDGTKNGFLTMGYFTRADLPFYHALADAFTVCDQYFCSVLGPTYPNRLLQMTGSLGADGSHGGPVLETWTDPVSHYGSLDWLTMPEVLTEAGVSWKVYQDPTSAVLFNVLPFFKSYSSPASTRDFEVAANGLTPQYPAQFEADVASGQLPAVSWILPPAACCEHPAAPPAYGEWLTAQVLQTLVSNPEVWARTVLLLVYDENGGWFDHVPPPVPGPMVTERDEIPSGDEFAGEYITAPLASSGDYTANGSSMPIYGPVGLGFRTPCVVVSPFSQGGYLCSEVFDHVSVLKLISARFGTPVPNASAWRLGTVSDMTGALALFAPPETSVPSLPPTSITDPQIAEQAVVNAFLGTEDEAPMDYPPPASNSGIPTQETSPRRKRIPQGSGAAASSNGAGAPGPSSSASHAQAASLGAGTSATASPRSSAGRGSSSFGGSSHTSNLSMLPAARRRGLDPPELASTAAGAAAVAGAALGLRGSARRILDHLNDAHDKGESSDQRPARSDEQMKDGGVRSEPLDVEPRG